MRTTSGGKAPNHPEHQCWETGTFDEWFDAVRRIEDDTPQDSTWSGAIQCNDYGLKLSPTDIERSFDGKHLFHRTAKELIAIGPHFK